jgi:hypothetical protein
VSSNKFLTIIDGVRSLVTAIATSAGVADALKIVMTDSTGRLSSTLMPVGIGADTFTAAATEALAAGNFVNVYDDAGTTKVRKADASNSRDANGFVLEAVSNAATATVYRLGTNNQLTSLTAGLTYYLSGSVAGGVTATAPTAGIIQELGTASSATALSFVDRGFTVIV